MLAGIDEAGRGPVIGPMVVAIAAVEDERALEDMNVKDSKLLNSEQREKLYQEITKALRVEYKVVGIKEIDRAVNNNQLNVLEQMVFAELLNRIKPEKVIVDCPVINTERFAAQLKSLSKSNAEIVAENKADFNHKIVAAASIVAKQIREEEIASLKKKIGIDFGSGYPSDPLTVKFLEEHWNHFDIFRKSWQTYKDIKDKNEQQTLV